MITCTFLDDNKGRLLTIFEVKSHVLIFEVKFLKNYSAEIKNEMIFLERTLSSIIIYPYFEFMPYSFWVKSI